MAACLLIQGLRVVADDLASGIIQGCRDFSYLPAAEKYQLSGGEGSAQGGWKSEFDGMHAGRAGPAMQSGIDGGAGP